MNIVELFALLMLAVLLCIMIAKVIDLFVKWAFVFHVAKKLKHVPRTRGPQPPVTPKRPKPSS